MSLVREARGLLDPLRADGWTKLAANSSAVLLAFDAALHALPPSAGDVSVQGGRIESVARDLGSQNVTSLVTSARIKTGMTETLSALEVLAEARPDRTRLEPWLRAARKAVSGLDRQQLAAFQPALVQDGFRTLSDAFLALARLPDPDELDTTRAAEPR